MWAVDAERAKFVVEMVRGNSGQTEELLIIA